MGRLLGLGRELLGLRVLRAVGLQSVAHLELDRFAAHGLNHLRLVLPFPPLGVHLSEDKALAGVLRDHHRALVAHEGLVVSTVAGGVEHLVVGPHEPLRSRVLIHGHDVVVPLAAFVVVQASACHHRSRTRLEEPVEHVDLVRPEVRDGPAGELAEPSPVAELER